MCQQVPSATVSQFSFGVPSSPAIKSFGDKNNSIFRCSSPIPHKEEAAPPTPDATAGLRSELAAGTKVYFQKNDTGLW
jgi:hypothetical protein